MQFWVLTALSLSPDYPWHLGEARARNPTYRANEQAS